MARCHEFTLSYEGQQPYVWLLPPVHEQADAATLACIQPSHVSALGALCVQTVQLGPFDVSSQEGWQQFAATLGALGGTSPGGPAGAQPAAGAAARASPFNFGNIFGGGAAQGGRGGRGRGGRGRGGPPGPAQQQAAAWWASVQQEISRQLSGVNVSGPGSQQAHLFDGLDRLLLSMESAGDREGGGAAAAGGRRGGRRQRAPDEDTLPAIHAVTQGEGVHCAWEAAPRFLPARPCP